VSQITSPQYRKAFILVTTLFFMWGLSYGLIDVLNKHFQVTLNVSKAQSGLIQAAYFGAYFVVAIPAGLFMEWKGYKLHVLPVRPVRHRARARMSGNGGQLLLLGARFHGNRRNPPEPFPVL